MRYPRSSWIGFSGRVFTPSIIGAPARGWPPRQIDSAASGLRPEAFDGSDKPGIPLLQVSARASQDSPPPPLRMVAVPLRRLQEVPRERVRGLPARHPAQFPAVDGVARDMARSVRDATDATAAR